EEQSARLIGMTGHPVAELHDRVDLFIVMGGDGTLLRLVRDLKGKTKPIMGINFGSLGFLTSFGGPEYARAARAIATGDYRVDERTMLTASVKRSSETILSRTGLNDVVVTRGDGSRLTRIESYIDQNLLTEYNADGLIIATATGSTAYSLSAGGPIVMPNSGVFVVTPICPHVLTNRSVIVSTRSVIRLRCHGGALQINLNIDGQESINLLESDWVTVQAAEEKLPLLFPNDLSFAEILGTKLRWSGSAI
ncbi:MAG: NAD(+)/NADH kinase, partial [Verrucomicrobia bacterium]|nr:NAD(+)/NADH kinase [Verrucomicrobiota bacterium]